MRTFAIGLMGILVASAAGEKCLDGRSDFINLPSIIGFPGVDSSLSYPLRCDTVYVPKGSRTVVNAGTLLYFYRKSAANLIRVEGTLVLLGVKDHYVTVAGGRDLRKNGFEPSKTAWGGIEVAPEGKLEMVFTGVFGATNPITVNSTQVKIVNSYFTGGRGIVRPDGSWYLLDSVFNAVNYLDFSRNTEKVLESNAPDLPSKLSSDEKAELLAQKPGFWSRPTPWLTLGGGAVLGVSGYFIFQWLEPGKSQPVNPSMDPVPPTP